VLGPAFIGYIAEYQLKHGVAEANKYNFTMYLMAGLLLIGAVCYLMVKPVDAKYHDADGPVTGMMPAGAPRTGGTRG
jgi:hypothetical protein